MARVLSCYGSGCAYEDSRGECRWNGRRLPYPCELEEMDEEERERVLYNREKDYEEDEG